MLIGNNFGNIKAQSSFAFYLQKEQKMHIFRKNKQQIADRHNYLQQSQQRLENTKKNEKTTSGLRVLGLKLITRRSQVQVLSPQP